MILGSSLRGWGNIKFALTPPSVYLESHLEKDLASSFIVVALSLI